jgi:hypothetical protein
MNENQEISERQAVTKLTSGDTESISVFVANIYGDKELRELTVHPLAKMIPVIAQGDLDRLIDDIKKHGVIDPLVMFEGKVLDGRNRLAVASVLGATVELEDFDGDKAAARSYVWSANAARRHLSMPQIALAAERFGFIDDAKREAGPDVPKTDGASAYTGAAPWARIAARKVGNITPRTLERFQEARIPEAPDTMRRIDEGEIRRVDNAVKEAVAERTVLTGLPIQVPPPVPRTPWDRLGCARSDVLAAERSILHGDRGVMTRQQFAERAREIQAALIRIEWLYRENRIT